MAKGIKGFDILAYRHVVDGEKLAREFCAAIDAEICIAGSINSFARIDTMFDIGPWTFTMGSALFEKKVRCRRQLRDNLKAVADYMASSKTYLTACDAANNLPGRYNTRGRRQT